MNAKCVEHKTEPLWKNANEENESWLNEILQLFEILVNDFRFLFKRSCCSHFKIYEFCRVLNNFTNPTRFHSKTLNLTHYTFADICYLSAIQLLPLEKKAVKCVIVKTFILHSVMNACRKIWFGSSYEEIETKILQTKSYLSKIHENYLCKWNMGLTHILFFF